MRSQELSQQNTRSKKIEAIRQQVASAYNLFDQFGRDEEALADITRAFIEDLIDYGEEDIRLAFKSWRKKHDKMPRPSNITFLIENPIRVNSHIMRWSEYQDKYPEKSFADFKKYVSESLQKEIENHA